MSIIRTPRPDHYTVINNAVFSDSDPLSWDAIGLLCYLLSKPDNWEVSPAALANTKRCGINKVHGLLKELRDLRFVIGKKNVNGTFDYYVYDAKQSEYPVITPNHEKPNQEKPNQEKPNQEKPNQEKPNQDLSRQINTDNKTNTDYLPNTEEATRTREKKPKQKKSAAASEKKEIEFTAEEQACYEWAIKDLNFWKPKITSRAKFLELYHKSDSGVRHQYNCFIELQTQKSLESATNTTQGINPTNGGHYATTNTHNQPRKKLSTAERQLYAAMRGEYYDKFQSGLISESEYQYGIKQYAT